MSTKQAQRIYEFGPYHVDGTKRLLLRDGEVIPLTPKGFEILLALIESHGEVVSKDSLIRRVWPDSFVEEGNLTYNISILRRTLGERAGDHQYIATIPGQGYQFVAKIRELLNGNAKTDSNWEAESVQEVFSGAAEHRSGWGAESIQEAVRNKSPDESFIGRVVRDKKLVIVALVVVTGLAGFGFGFYKFISGRQPRGGLAAEPFQKMKMTRLTSTGKATWAAISPDGKYVAHTIRGGSKSSLWLRHIATDSDKEIIATAQFGFGALTFSPDGNYVYFLRVELNKSGRQLYRVPVLGGSIQKLASDVDSTITFSPGGRKIAYARGYPEKDEAHLIIANADGTDEQTLLVKRSLLDVFSGALAWGPTWSPDGEMIAFALRRDEPGGKYWNVMTVRVKDQAEQQITFQKWSSLGQLAWLSDGRALIVAASDEASFSAYQLWHISYSGGEVRRITNDTDDYLGVGLTADSTVLVTVRSERTSNIWMAPGGDASRAAQITSSNLDGVDGICWTPDGRIVYTTTARGSSNIWMMNTDGTDQEQVTIDAGDNFNPSVSPDGRYIVFVSNRTGHRCVWRADIDGGNPKQLTYGIDARFPEITADGKSIVYSDFGASKQTLWKVPIEGGGPVHLQLTPYAVRHSAIAPDGKTIVFDFIDEQAMPKRWRIGVGAIDGGHPAKIFDLPHPPRQTVRWTSDGRSLTYLEARNGAFNIWAQPLDGAAPKQLTNFTTDRIVAYAWSRDGKQLACARGSQISDVVLISSIR